MAGVQFSAEVEGKEAVGVEEDESGVEDELKDDVEGVLPHRELAFSAVQHDLLHMSCLPS